MQRYQLVHAIVHAVIAGLLYLFLIFITDTTATSAAGNPFHHFHFFTAISGWLAPHAEVVRWAALILLPVLFNRSAFIANIIIEKIPGLSARIRKLLSGHDFIEGDWPLVVMQPDNKTPKYFGFLTITYTGGQLQVEGEDWNPDGTEAVKFKSQKSSYAAAERKLEYWYAQGAALRAPTMFGYTKIFFFPDRGRIERHAGEFLDKEHTSPPFYAKRIRYKLFQRRLRSTDDKIAAAKRLWAEIEPSILRRPDARIERDFV